MDGASVGDTEGLAYCAYEVYKHRDEVAYELEYSINAKGYNEFKITGVFDISACDEEEPVVVTSCDVPPAAASPVSSEPKSWAEAFDNAVFGDDELPFPEC
jgi:hypothetical protein